MYELWKTDHGVDGWAAQRTLEARFTTSQLAANYLINRNFTHWEYGSWWHSDVCHRHTIGAISYQIKPMPVDNIPLNP
jgi:hypothetical protein